MEACTPRVMWFLEQGGRLVLGFKSPLSHGTNLPWDILPKSVLFFIIASYYTFENNKDVRNHWSQSYKRRWEIR